MVYGYPLQVYPIVWDHLLSSPPSFMYAFIVSVLVSSRVPLLGISKANDFKLFFKRRNSLNIPQVLIQAYKIHESTPASCAASTFLVEFTPLLKGSYPLFTAAPEFIQNYAVKVKSKIHKDEEVYIKERKKGTKKLFGRI